MKGKDEYASEFLVSHLGALEFSYLSYAFRSFGLLLVRVH